MKAKGDSPCKGCEERHTGCHAECLMFKTWHEEFTAKKELLRKESGKERMLDDVAVASHRRGMKRRHFR